MVYEPWHDKTNKIAVRLVKTQISLGIHPVWSESSLSAWRKLRPLATHWAHSEDSDQTGRTRILLVLSCRGSYAVVQLFEYFVFEALHVHCVKWFQVSVNIQPQGGSLPPTGYRWLYKGSMKGPETVRSEFLWKQPFSQCCLRNCTFWQLPTVLLILTILYTMSDFSVRPEKPTLVCKICDFAA